MSSYSDINGNDYSTSYSDPKRGTVARALERADVTQEILYTLTGAGAGATALVAKSRVQHSTSELGGVRAIETRNKINRATTATDLSEMQVMVNRTSRIALASNAAGLWLGKAL